MMQNSSSAEELQAILQTQNSIPLVSVYRVELPA